MSKQGRARKKSGDWARTVGVLVAVVGAGVTGAVLFGGLGESGVGEGAVRAVYPLEGGQFLLVKGSTYQRNLAVSSAGSDASNREFLVVSADGEVLGEVGESRSATGSWQDNWSFYGVSGDVVWLGMRGDQERRVYARRLPSLELVDGIREAIAAQPMLEKRFNDYRPLVLGTIPRGLVLLGADQRVYVMAADGQIEQLPKDVKCQPTSPCSWTEESHEIKVAAARAGRFRASGPLADKMVDVAALDLIQPYGAGVSFEEPRSIVVWSSEFVGPGSSDLISRATGTAVSARRWKADEVVWTTSARDLVAPTELKGDATAHLLWLEERDGRLLVLVQASTPEQQPELSVHLVEVDPASGTRVSHQLVHRPADRAEE